MENKEIIKNLEIISTSLSFIVDHLQNISSNMNCIENTISENIPKVAKHLSNIADNSGNIGLGGKTDVRIY